MDKKAKWVMYVATFALLLVILMFSGAFACQVSDFYLTKEGSLAAVTPEALNDVLVSSSDNEAKLAELVKNGTVLKLKGGIKVRVVERSVEWKMLKIKLPDADATYWVKDGALSPIDCNEESKK